MLYIQFIQLLLQPFVLSEALLLSHLALHILLPELIVNLLPDLLFVLILL